MGVEWHKMIVLPKEKPVLRNLNVYYLDIEKLIEHYQGEVGSGGVFFKSPAAEGVIFFDKDEVLNAVFQEKQMQLQGQEAVGRLIKAGGHDNFTVDIYHLSAQEVYFWSSIPGAEKIYRDLSTEFTDLEKLIKKMSSERLNGYIDVSINGGKEAGMIFIVNGKIIGGSFSWDKEQANISQRNQELLIEKTRQVGATFNVCRISLKKLKKENTSEPQHGPASENVLLMVEEFLRVFENTVSANKKLKGDFSKLLKKKFVENAEKYAFLDPFAGEFDYSNRKISFSGTTGDHELLSGVMESVSELARELGLMSGLVAGLSVWSETYARELKKFDITL